MKRLTVPERVQRAAAKHCHTRLPALPRQWPVGRGDLVVVSNEDVTRVVCVTEVTGTHLVAVLCSNEVEMATDHDVVVRRPGTYDLLLEAECYLVVLESQVRDVVGTVDLDVVNAVRESLLTDGESVDTVTRSCSYCYVGTPLAGVFDARRRFMERELDDVVVLRDLAHKVLFGDGWNPGYGPQTRS